MDFCILGAVAFLTNLPVFPKTLALGVNFSDCLYMANILLPFYITLLALEVIGIFGFGSPILRLFVFVSCTSRDRGREGGNVFSSSEMLVGSFFCFIDGRMFIGVF
jgi:hypothetical protein